MEDKTEFGSLHFVVHLLKRGYVLLSFAMAAFNPNCILYYGVTTSYKDMVEWEEYCKRCPTHNRCTAHPLRPWDHVANITHSGHHDHYFISVRLECGTYTDICIILSVFTDEYKVGSAPQCENVEEEGGGGGGGRGGGGGKGGGGGEEATNSTCEVKCRDDVQPLIFDALKHRNHDCMYVRIYGYSYELHKMSLEYTRRVDFPWLVVGVFVIGAAILAAVYCIIRVFCRWL